MKSHLRIPSTSCSPFPSHLPVDRWFLNRAGAAIILALMTTLGATPWVFAQPQNANPPGKTDSEIRQCIEDRLTSSEKLGSQGFSIKVNNQEATLTGTARNSGSKGAVTRIARTCGAVKVTNLITAPSPKRSARPDSTLQNF
jgi:hypothetical protein